MKILAVSSLSMSLTTLFNMKKKQCKKCLGNKSVIEFGKHNNTKDRLNPKCKDCVRDYYKQNKSIILFQLKNNYKNKRGEKIQYSLQYQYKLKDGAYSVYLLPYENYVGVTDNITVRKSGHKHLGRKIQGFRVLAQFSTRKEALNLEKFFHELGYLGASSTYK